MTSSLVIEICNIDALEPHPNADRLAIATIKGWKTCVGYDPETKTADFKPGDSAVYFPPDSILPPELAEKLNVVNYCSTLPKNYDGTTPPGYRVKAARLRGFASYGFVSRLESVGLDQTQNGTDVAEFLGVTKYVPPVKVSAGDAEPDHPAFHKYSSIENIGNFPTLIPEGEPVVVTEKIHGSNNRVGLVRNGNEWEFMCGSHQIRRKEFNANGGRSMYWTGLTAEVKALLRFLQSEWNASQSVIVFGEMFGPGVQDLHYGQSTHVFRVFDIAVDGKYVDATILREICLNWKIEAVPLLYEGPFSTDIIRQLTDGPTLVAEIPEDKKKFNGREGVVVKTATEQISPLTNGRMILKSISVDYLARKGGTDNE